MKLTLVCVVLIAVGSLIIFIRSGLTQPLPLALPGCGGRGRPLEFELGAAALLVLGCWGLGRVFRSRQDDE